MKRTRELALKVLNLQSCHALWIAAVSLALAGCGADHAQFSQTSSTTSQTSVQISAATSGGNGDYYGGKPSPGMYQRFDANSAIENLRVTENSAQILKLDTVTGKTIVIPIDLHAIEFAAYLPGRLGVGHGLYTNKSLLANEGATEAWCRKPGSTSQSGYDVVVEKTDRDTLYRARFSQSIVAKGAYVGERTTTVEQVAQDRNSGDRVRYRARGFELEIRFETFNSVSGKFQGRLRFDQDAQVDTATECRVGGALDNQLPMQ